MVSGYFAVSFQWAMLGLTVPFVLLRLYSRWWITRNASSSDIVVIVTWFLFGIGVSQDFATYRLGLIRDDFAYRASLIDLIDDKAALVKILKICFTTSIPYYGTLWGIKVSLLLLYYKLIPESIPFLRRALHVVSAVVGASWIIVICLNTLWCLPVERNWSINKDEACFAYSAHVPYFVTTALHILTDFMIILLPFPLLKVLNLTPRKRLCVAALFALGSLCVICTILRVIEVGLDANVPTINVWSSVEQATGIIVVCAPALKCFWSPPPLPPSQVDLESANRSIHGQQWWTNGRATPKRRESNPGGAHEILPKAFLRFSNSHQAHEDNAWERVPDKQEHEGQDSSVVIAQRLATATDTSTVASSDDATLVSKPEVSVPKPT